MAVEKLKGPYDTAVVGHLISFEYRGYDEKDRVFYRDFRCKSHCLVWRLVAYKYAFPNFVWTV